MLPLILFVVLIDASLAGYGVGQASHYEGSQYNEVFLPEDNYNYKSTPLYNNPYWNTPRTNRPSYQRSPYAGVKTRHPHANGGHVKGSGSGSNCLPKISNAKSICGAPANIYNCNIECLPGYQFPFEKTKRIARCDNGKIFMSMPEYPITEPCAPICLPPCQHGGVCVSPDQCNCPREYSGSYCQFEKRNCIDVPPLPKNSQINCNVETCHIECLRHHQFPDSSTIANMFCRDGQWVPARTDWAAIPDCKPICDPPCLNGGVCLSLNTCNCPMNYRGLHCEYSADACNISSLGFNGNARCSGDEVSMSCELQCPPPGRFATRPAPRYTCLYSAGIFEPQPVAQCYYGSNVIVSPVESTNSGHSYSVEKSEVIMHGWSSGSSNHRHTPVTIETPAPGVCFTWGGLHYKTFDGQVYGFQSPCWHILVRESKNQLFTVMVKHGGCTNKQTVCPSKIDIYLEDKHYKLRKDENGGVKLRSDNGETSAPARLPGLRVSMEANNIVVHLDSVQLSIKWDTQQLVQVQALESLWNRTEGLCGTLDGRIDTDMLVGQRRKASNVVAFSQYWQAKKTGDSCHDVPDKENACNHKSKALREQAELFCTNALESEKFSLCAKILDSSLLRDACQWDYCRCSSTNDSESCACQSVAVFAQQCVHIGLKQLQNWRDEHICPMECSFGKVYKSCGPQAQPTCAVPTTQIKESCVEGCFCPEGLLLHEGKCIEKRECPCQLRNKDYPSGATTRKDCNTCTCSEGEWVCTNLKCGARCSAVGDPHYTTFDGRRYDFMGKCSYILLASDNYTINVENVACSGAISEAMNLASTSSNTRNSPSCTKAVTVTYGSAVIKLEQRGVVVVNGISVQDLPALVNDVVVRPISSLFIAVELPNGVDILWDTVTSVYVDVPPSFRSQTKGLCGTFNDNQIDDFLTREGDVEQSVAPFVNKWKTREVCDDVSSDLTPDTCKLNIQNKQMAAKYCNKLNSELFQECQLLVDVAPYYEACLYDMCACEQDISKCLCPIFAAYAAECAAKDVKILWRENVTECAIQCTGGQTYQVCADSCLRTCSDVSQHLFKHVRGSRGKCESKCVEGCACPPGQVLQVNGECIPSALCPCHHERLEYRPGHKEVRDGKKGKVMCTCTMAKWKCRVATPEEILTYPRTSDIQDKCSADSHLEFTTCEPSEPRTCKTMHLPESHTTAVCRPGCQCKQGYVLESVSKKCVLPVDCPCHHGGQSYPDGHIIPEECNTCECKKGKWECSQRQCTGMCSVWGDSHFTTFDGLNFEFQGVCTYLMAQGTDGGRSFTVEIQNDPCGTTGATCVKSIIFKISGDKDEIVFLTKNSPLPDTADLERIYQYEAGAFVFLDVASMGVLLQWDKATRLTLKLDPKWKGRVKGLCGNYNNDNRDDLRINSAGDMVTASTLSFVDSWRLSPACIPAANVPDHCEERPFRKDWATMTCGALSQPPFTKCHSEVPPDEYIKRCERDACACDSGGDCECICVALATYAQLCTARGVIFKWRSQNLCPCQCDEETSAYDPCISACPEETCENTLFYNAIKKDCSQNTCIEGCKLKKRCEMNKVFANSTLATCLPRSECSIPCLTLPDGRKILEGEIMEEDACHQCHCSRKKKSCTGEPCSTLAPPTTHQPNITSTSRPDETLESNDKTIVINDESCKPGWSRWINNYIAQTIEVKGENISVEHERMPIIEDLLNSEGFGECDSTMMKKIECRTVKDHKGHADLPFYTACSLDRGFVCRSFDSQPCPEVEIRVLCKCDKEPVPASNLLPSCLDPVHPNYEHPKDCHKFYQCAPGMGPQEHPDVVEKTCGDGMWYNPNTMICDWPNNVEPLRPLCADNERSTTPLDVSTTPSDETSGTTSLCPEEQEWSECAIECDKLCHYYKQQLRTQGKCTDGKRCEAGCTRKDWTCALGMLSREPGRCVAPRNCTCASGTGDIVKPGGMKTENSCIRCQCLDNTYSCDDRECKTLTTARPEDTTTEEMTTIDTTTIHTTLEPSILTPSTTSPPPDCDENRFKYILWSEKKPNGKLTASSSLSSDSGPNNAVLNSNEGAGSWTPKESNQNQYIQVEFPRQTPMYGVVTQGSALFSESVLQYQVWYGDDGVQFSHADNAVSGGQIFEGSYNNREAVKQFFKNPIEAKFLRIVPLNWAERISMRFDVIGCDETAPDIDIRSKETATTSTTTPLPVTISSTTARTAEQPQPLCTEPMGFSKNLPLQNVQVSSEKDKVQNLDLNQPIAWHPTYNTPGEWIYFDFTGPRNITGILIKGGKTGWLNTFIIMYAPEMKPDEKLKSWSFITNDDGTDKVFAANFDSDTPVKILFPRPIRLRYLKVLPQSWNKNMEIRMEPLGCFEPYPNGSVLPNPLIRTHCKSCPGLTEDLGQCNCTLTGTYFDGKTCISKDRCPCYVGHITYSVGAAYKSANCEDCICKMGGIPDCKPVKCPSCPEGQVLKRAACNCDCKPCEPGERACPTSSVCIPSEKWCDGVVDCEDDERRCPPSTPLPTTIPSTTTTPHTICPTPICAKGYTMIQTNRNRHSYQHANSLDSVPMNDDALDNIPPPKPRKAYSRYFKGVKGGRNSQIYTGIKTKSAPLKRASFTLPKPSLASQPSRNIDDCPKFKCVPNLPPSGHVPDCSVPDCPPPYKLRAETKRKGPCLEYTCTPPPKRDANCSLIGRTITTFDGIEYKYDICDHLVARDAKEDKWNIIIQKNCSLASGCARELVITQEGDEIRFLPNLQIEYNARPYTIDQTVKIGMETNSFFLSKNGDVLFLVSKKYLFWVTYNTRGDVRTGVPGKLSGAVDGLCGYFDGWAANDRRLPNGTSSPSTEQFAEAWARQGLPPNACKARVCPIALQKKAYEMCNAVTEKTLSACGRVLYLPKWRTQCLELVCSCAQGDGATNASRDTHDCLCSALQSFVVECQSKDPTIDLQGWRTDNNCPGDCAAPLVHHDCYRRRCEPVCGAGGGGAEGDAQCARAAGVCFPGCFCPEGKLRRGDDCVAPDLCRDCVCDGKGTPVKYTTFERVDLPFSGNCTYIAARDKHHNGEYKFQVFVTNGACKSDSRAVCVEALHIIYGLHSLHLQKNNKSTVLEVTVDGMPVYKSQKNDWLSLKMLPNRDVSVVIPAVQLEVNAVLKNMDFAVKIPSSLYSNKTEGLCGNCRHWDEVLKTKDGNTTTDLQEYGLSWLADEKALHSLDIQVEESCKHMEQSECLPPPPESDPCFKLLDTESFGACHPLVDPVPHLAACQHDLCELGEQLGACSALERYAAECRREAVCVQWRSDAFCPYACENNLEYRSCGLGCTLTCDNYKDLSKHPELCREPIAEGCFCPEGKVLVNNTCIEHTKCFPCGADAEHYVGDEWQRDACTHCKCFKSAGRAEAEVSCVKQECAPPLCAPGLAPRAAPPQSHQCCPQYTCELKKKENEPLKCKLPPKIKCGIDQVVTADRDSTGCTIYTCRCIPREQCPSLNSSVVASRKPGFVATVDTSGCCPREQLVCNKSTCPQPPSCPEFHDLVQSELPGNCCLTNQCVLPADKCVVKLEWESGQEGGERRRAEPRTVLKSRGEVWSDGACRTCKCVGNTAECTRAACAEPPHSDTVVLEAFTPPFACCPLYKHTACKHHDVAFSVGEKVTSPQDPCVTYECRDSGSNTLERSVNRQECNTQCKLGWEYFPPSPHAPACCGECRPVACVVDGQLHSVGDTWTSGDMCTTFSCVGSGDDIRVQSEVKSCANASESLARDYQLKTVTEPGECCPKFEPVACIYNGTVYKEGENWTTSDACETSRCVRDADDHLVHARAVTPCRECARGLQLSPPEEGECCGACEPVACLDGDELRDINTTWTTEDNCTTVSCSVVGGQPALTKHVESCPDVSGCPLADLYTKGCCQFCKPSASSQKRSSCAAVLKDPATTRKLIIYNHSTPSYGQCTNLQPIPGFAECIGECPSSVLFNKDSRSHDLKTCKCCTPKNFTSVTVELSCYRGTYSLAVSYPTSCQCETMACNDSIEEYGGNGYEVNT